MDFETIEEELQNKQNAYNKYLGEFNAISTQKTSIESELEREGKEIILLAKCIEVLHSLSTTIQERFLKSIETLISEGLSVVFGELIQFKITAVARAKRINLDFSIVDESGMETDLLSARGGGLVSLCGVLLRIVMARLMNDRIRQILILDEPLAHLSAEYQPLASELLSKLSTELGIQIIMVSHNQECLEFADTIYRLVRDNKTVKAIKE